MKFEVLRPDGMLRGYFEGFHDQVNGLIYVETPLPEGTAREDLLRVCEWNSLTRKSNP
jgi:hypothetical protein